MQLSSFLKLHILTFSLFKILSPDDSYQSITPIRALMYFFRRRVHRVNTDSVYRTNTTLTVRYLGQGTLVDLRLSYGCHYFWYSFLSKESCELSGGDDFP